MEDDEEEEERRNHKNNNNNHTNALKSKLSKLLSSRGESPVRAARRSFAGTDGVQPPQRQREDEDDVSLELSVQSEMVRPGHRTGSHNINHNNPNNHNSLLGALQREASDKSLDHDVLSIKSEAILHQPQSKSNSVAAVNGNPKGNSKKPRTRSMGKTTTSSSSSSASSNGNGKGDAIMSSSSAHEIMRRNSLGQQPGDQGGMMHLSSSSAHDRRGSMGSQTNNGNVKSRNRLHIVSSNSGHGSVMINNNKGGGKINSSVSVGGEPGRANVDHFPNARRAKSSSRASPKRQQQQPPQQQQPQRPGSRTNSPRSNHKGKISGASPRTRAKPKISPKVVAGTSLAATAATTTTTPGRTRTPGRSKSPKRTSKQQQQTTTSNTAAAASSPKSESTDLMLSSVLTGGGETSISPRSAKSSRPKLSVSLKQQQQQQQHRRSKSSMSVPDIGTSDTFTYTTAVGELMPPAPLLDGGGPNYISNVVVDANSIPTIPLNNNNQQQQHAKDNNSSAKKMVMAPSPKVRRPRLAGLPPTLGIGDSEQQEEAVEEENLFDHLKLDPLDKEAVAHVDNSNEGGRLTLEPNDDEAVEFHDEEEYNVAASRDPEGTTNNTPPPVYHSQKQTQRRYSNDDRATLQGKSSLQRRNSAGGSNKPSRKAASKAAMSVGSNHSTGNTSPTGKKIRVSRGHMELAKQLASVTKEKDQQLDSLQIEMRRMELENQKLKEALEAAGKNSSLSSSLALSSGSTAATADMTPSTSFTNADESSSSLLQLSSFSSPSPSAFTEESPQKSPKSGGRPQHQQHATLVQTGGQIRPRPTLYCLPGLRSLPFWTQAAPSNNDNTQVAYQESSLSWTVEVLEQSYEILWNEYQHVAPMIPSDHKNNYRPKNNCSGNADMTPQEPYPTSPSNGTTMHAEEANVEEDSPGMRGSVASRRKSMELRERLRKQEALVAVLKQRRSSLQHSRSSSVDPQPTSHQHSDGSFLYSAKLQCGDWDWHSYTLGGRIKETFQQNFSQTLQILEKLGSKSLLLSHQFSYCHTFFSTLNAKSRTAPHSSPVNWRLRLYLPLLVPGNGKDCGIRVLGNTSNGNQNATIRYWHAGRAVLLDDSYPHEEWNDCPPGGAPLVLFIVDLWHPDVTPAERQELVDRFATPLEPE